MEQKTQRPGHLTLKLVNRWWEESILHRNNRNEVVDDIEINKENESVQQQTNYVYKVR